jgi:hypothetical protein
MELLVLILTAALVTATYAFYRLVAALGTLP